MNDVIDEMAKKLAVWLSGEGKDSDIIISSRARLARNLQNIPFVDRASEDEQKSIISKVLLAAENVHQLKDGLYFGMSSIGLADRQFFVERRLISTDFVDKENPRGVLFSKDEKASVMINEEDHLRIQLIYPGFSLDEAWYHIRQVDEEFSQHLDYAFSNRFGYLTACPTNVGTGVRLSVFIHLPVLTFTREIEKIFAEMIPAGIAVRGFYGEGSKIIGNFFQISNQYTLGCTEQGILDRMMPLINRFIVQEREAREKIINDQRIIIEDKIYRAIGILSKSKILTSMEFLDLLSALRLGVDMNIFSKIEGRIFNELMVQTQPVHIQKLKGEKMSELERDIFRANLVREKLHLN